MWTLQSQDRRRPHPSREGQWAVRCHQPLPSSGLPPGASHPAPAASCNHARPQCHLQSCNRCLKPHPPHPWSPLQPKGLRWMLSRSKSVMVWCLPRSYHFATAAQQRISSLPGWLPDTHIALIVFLPQEIHCQEFIAGLHFYYFLLGNFIIMILWLGREHSVFFFVRLILHIIPSSDGETSSSAWNMGRITKKVNNLGGYREIWEHLHSELDI